MITMLIHDRDKKEQEYIRYLAKQKAAYLTDEKWEYLLTNRLQELSDLVQNDPLLHIICMDITEERALEMLKDIRSKYRQAFLMVVADTSLSPMKYMNPGILPTSLLLKPCDKENVRQVVEELLDAYVDAFFAKEDQNSFVINSKEGKIHIPYSQIFYFESREKKVFVQTGSEEYGFYSTIEKMEEELPPYFMRCHRSFIVNTRKIRKVMLSKNLICMYEDRMVPLSRSYKAVMKDLGRMTAEDTGTEVAHG